MVVAIDNQPAARRLTLAACQAPVNLLLRKPLNQSPPHSRQAFVSTMFTDFRAPDQNLFSLLFDVCV